MKPSNQSGVPTRTFNIIRNNNLSAGVFPDAKLVIQKVSTFGPAKNAGITAEFIGCRILAVNGTPVHSLQEYTRRTSLPEFSVTVAATVRMRGGRSINRQDERRRKAAAAILSDTKLFIEDLMNICSTQEVVIFTDENEYARQLCYSLERIFMFGLKSSWFGGTVSFYRFVQATAKTSTNAQLRSDLRTIEKVDELTEHGKGRALLRIALKKKSLIEFIVEFTRELPLCKQWYQHWSIIGNVPNLRLLLKVLQNLDNLDAPLVLQYDNFHDLNSRPSWEL